MSSKATIAGMLAKANKATIVADTSPKATITDLTITAANFDEIHRLLEYKSLLVLRCSDIGLKVMPNLPPTLQSLDCSFNELTSLTSTYPLPENLLHLDCRHNRIASLYWRLPLNLQTLRCSNNRLRWMPDPLPQNLRILTCSHNMLIRIPDLPPHIVWLECTHNQLMYLPAVLPVSLVVLKTRNNTLELESREEK